MRESKDENPCAIDDCVMWILAFVGIAFKSGVMTTGKSAFRNMPAYRSAIPCPADEKMMEKPWLTASCIAATARSASPRSGSIALKSKKVASVSRSVPYGLKAREVSAQRLIS